MHAIAIADFARLTSSPLEYLIYKLLPKPGRVILVGPQKVGKSFFALQVGLAVAQGKPFLGRPVQQGRVLYLQFDTPGPIWRERIQEILAAGVDISGEFYTNYSGEKIERINLFNTKDQQELHRLIASEVNADLVIMDVFRKLYQGKENDSDVSMRVWGVLNEITQGRSLLLLHHAGKPQKDIVYSASNASRGSSFIGGEVDASWYLQRNTLEIESRIDEGCKYQVSHDENTGFILIPELDNMKDKIEVLITLCSENPDLSHNEIFKRHKASLGGLSRATYHRLLRDAQCIHTISSEMPHTPDSTTPTTPVA